MKYEVFRVHRHDYIEIDGINVEGEVAEQLTYMRKQYSSIRNSW